MSVLRSQSRWRISAAARVAAFLFITRLASAADISHTFQLDTHDWQDKPKTVNVAGAFNGWSKDATPMRKDSHGVYSVRIDLPPGVMFYKFVIDGSRWIGDPKSDKALEVDDNYGGRNSAVMVGVDPRKLPTARDNAITLAAVQHDPGSSDDLEVVDTHSFRVRVRTQPNDVKQVSVRLADASAAATPLTKISSDLWADTYAGVVQADATPARYTITLVDGTATVDVGKTPQQRKAGSDSPAVPPITVELKPRFTTPDWARTAVWYQIFPERFRNGEKSNDPGDAPLEHLIRWTSDWWKDQPGENPAGADNFYKGVGNVWQRRYGGDIQGIQQELPYLRSLGVTAIYLNPIFAAESMHKYDTSDYRHIDPHFGVRETLPPDGEADDPATWKWSKSDQVFLEFLDAAHKQGFKVIIDGVFNHVGKACPFFQDVLEKGRGSKYVDWFEITDATPGHVKYKSWDGDGALPVFKKDEKLGLVHGPREHVLAVVKRWLAPDGDPSRGVDGIRLDVATDIPHPFWIEFRNLVKQTKPDAYISGEIWDWAQPWLGGDQFDAVMNYQFAMAGQEFFVNQQKALTPTQFEQRLDRLVYTYPLQIAAVQMNLYDSHDTDRLASMFVNPDLGYDAANRIQDSGPKYKADKPDEQQRRRMLQAVAFQMSFVGAPMIYYGDECGMWSPDDPSDRQPMVWRDLQPYDDPQVTFDPQTFSFYQRAIAARAQLPALSGISFTPLLADDAHSTLVFKRGGARPVYVAINRSAEKQVLRFNVASTKSMIDWMSAASAELMTSADQPPKLAARSSAPLIAPRDGVVSIELEPYTTAILSEK